MGYFSNLRHYRDRPDKLGKPFQVLAFQILSIFFYSVETRDLTALRNNTKVNAVRADQ